jgi:hypothetical protein
MHTTQSTLRRIRGAVALLALALTFAISPAAAQWTPKQRAACEPDAMRLCNQYLPDIQRTSACMSHYRRYLSPACRAVFPAAAPAPPAGEQRDELASLHLRGHSITSLASASSVGGTVRPSTLEVFRLMISSTFVDCCTGKSAGFSPKDGNLLRAK